MNRDLAVVGMVCKVPGAENIEQFWSMLINGQEGLRSLTPEERNSSSTATDENVVHAGGYIEGIDHFDPELFGYTSRDALFMDPQHRLFLQACAQALEISGNASDKQSVGVFASAGHNAYLTEVILKHGIEEAQQQAALLGNSPDCLATRVSYCLDLTGPSMTIQSGCSSSLVAIHQARLALLAKQCDIALAGGISLIIPHHQGYKPIHGGFASPDGHCRPFSSDAAGTVFASGYGVVVLKRLDDAIHDGDIIYSVIKGSAINNDGANKASFTAPSVQGQTQVITKALRVAGVSPKAIQYIETHGTATPIGDPIEIAALSEVFQSQDSSPSQCTIGSVKANIGHLDVAAGIIGLIKTSLMLHHKTFPPQIHFKEWNPRIPTTSSFQINTIPKAWQVEENTVRRAGISAFGFGGTNAHVVLEEHKDTAVNPVNLTDKQGSLIVLSGQSPQRLLAWIATLHDFLTKTPELTLSSLAYTLQVGYKHQIFRYATHAQSIADLLVKLQSVTAKDIIECEQHYEPLPTKADNLQTEWLSGARIDWQRMYSEPIRKCSLPAYPLQTKSYWLAEQSITRNRFEKRHNAYEQWIYQSMWHEIQVPVNKKTEADKQKIMLIGDINNPSLQRFVNECKKNNQPYCLLDITQLEQAAYAGDFAPTQILHWVEFPNSWEEIPQAIQKILRLTTDRVFRQATVNYAFIVNGMSELFYRDHLPGLSALLAFSRGIRQEMPHIQTILIDLDPRDSADIQCKHIYQSIHCLNLYDYVTWRDDKCWQISYQNLVTDQPISDHTYFKPYGTYLITGGFGNVASVHIEFLATAYQARLVLVGRTSVPEEKSWEAALQDPATPAGLKKKIQQLIHWREKGFSILPMTADITLQDEFRKVCQKVETTVGNIDGIIHIAGVGSNMHYKVLSELTAEHSTQLFCPKLRGIEVIEQTMQEFNIPDCVIISSISSALAGIGLAAYASVHNLLDAYVKKHHPTWRIMNWDAWNFHLHNPTESTNSALGADLDKSAITFAEGLEVLRIVFNQPVWQQLYISTVDLMPRIKRWVYRNELDKKEKKNQRTVRPALRSEYLRAATPMQEQLINLWENLIGVEPIGIQDNFFELGGDSLLAIELISQIQKTCHHTCTIMDLFAAGTIEKLAEKIRPSGNKKNQKFMNALTRAAKQREIMLARSGKSLI